MTPVFALLDDAQDALTELVTGLLMVAGGFLVGLLLPAIARHRRRDASGSETGKIRHWQ